MYDGCEAEHPVNVATLRSLCECAGGERAALVEGEREPLAQRAALALTVWLVDRPVNAVSAFRRKEDKPSTLPCCSASKPAGAAAPSLAVAMLGCVRAREVGGAPGQWPWLEKNE